MALWYLGEQLAGLPFVPFDIFDWLARILPGDVITLGIDTIVRTIDALNLGSTSAAAKTIEQLQAIALVLGGAVILGVVAAWLLRVTSWRGWQVGALLGLAALLPIIVIEFDLGVLGDPALATLWLALTIIGWAVILASLLDAQEVVQVSEQTNAGRRAALAKIAGGSLALALGAWGVGRLLSSQAQPTGAGQPLANLTTATPEATQTPAPEATKMPAVEPSATAAPSPAATTSAQTPTSNPPTATPTKPSPTATATMRDRVQPASGMRLELTPNEDFYRIDINTRPVVIDGESWALEVDGLFDNARPLTLEDLMAYSPVTQAITLSCISNRVGGDLIGTSNWTGARLRDVLKDLGLRPEAKELFVEGADSFHDSVAMEDLMDPRTLLVYGMNGETLPVKHGFPLRIYIPNRYGMKQPKWITRIEAIDEEGPGYWVSRGWNAEARPQIVSVIDTVAVEEAVDGAIPLGGIAWAGDRGIQKVEVQVDDGEWLEATLRTPPLSSLTWVQWRYDWPMVSGPHRFRVRATDGTGELQIEEAQGVRPNGATGYHEELIDI
jgi:DMSO/TMAO reductase YedYZ molybdopterin-dependent catalytic subunit